MRRILPTVALGAAVVGASIAIAAPGRQADAQQAAAGPIPALHCSVTKIQIFFWPHGHGAIPQIGFPAFAPPHLEIYRAGFPDSSRFLAYMSATGYSPGPSCVRTTDTSTQPLMRHQRFVTTSKRRRIQCSFRHTVFGFQFVPKKDAGGQIVAEQLRVMGGGVADTLVTADINSNGTAKLKYAKRACRPLSIPPES